ncbi:hypothetical protein DXG03_003571 [Asterophora parasitica]|uniref:Uncharacterized protein n=1 Tax=Asterophora parasitica TaxID=117018 RepID=A0A9P7G358_9AGAR|nr:hypothetical protein DXG03_003571 [Asterophora parasitica]
MLLFIASILSFLWRTGSVADPEGHAPLSVRASFGPRIAVTGAFVVGMVYLVLIVKTLRSYGTADDGPGTAAWRRKAAQAPVGRMGFRARDIDAAMERRGRERQRSTSGPRRREEPPEETRGASVEAQREERKGLRSILGLGIVGAKEQNFGGQLDLEKGEAR